MLESAELQSKAQSQLLDLAAGDPERALALVEALEERRRQTHYTCYWEPHKAQRRFWKQLKSDQDIWLVLGANSAGKTELGAELATAWLLGKEYFRRESNWKWIEPLPIPDPPNNVRAVGLNSDMLRDPIWEKLTGSAEHGSFFPGDGSVISQNNHLFTASFTNGSKFQGKSADVDPKTHGGATLAFDWIDEECSYEIFKENSLRTRRGGKLLVTATPLDDVGTVAHPWIFDLIERWRAGDTSIGVIFMSMDENPHLDPDYVRKQKARFAGAPDESARLHGIPSRRSGLYYKQWRFEQPLWVPAYDFPRDGFRSVMIDPAVTGTVGALWAHYDSRGKMTLYREYKAKGLTVSQHVEAIITENRGDPINLWFCDPFMGRQKVPDSSSRDRHLTVLEVWRRAGLPRLQIPPIDYDLALARSHEYMKAAFDPTDPHPPVEVFDHLKEWEWEIARYVLDSIVQGPNRGDIRDKPRKGRDGASTLMECYQYLAGMNLRARPSNGPLQPMPTAALNYFADPLQAQRITPRPWVEEPW